MPIALAHTSWRRLIRFIAPDGITYFGQPIDPDVDIGLAIRDGQRVYAHIWDIQKPWEEGRKTGQVELVGKLLSPLSAEMSGTIRATGLSYKDHAAEMGLPYPQVPVLFFKPPNTLADPNTAIPIPKVAQDDEMDYEVELAIILGRDTKDVSEEDALGCVLGYTVANDLTARKHQTTSSQWGYAKGFDKFFPIGPVIVSAREVSDPHVFSLQTRLNGELMQDGSARKMIFPVQKVISYLSQGTTLPAGTIIITGTPPGIGDGRDLKVWLKHGDEVHCWISHGVGTLVNSIEYE